MERQHNWPLLRDARQPLEEHGECAHVVNVRWSMKRRDDVVSADPKTLGHSERASGLSLSEQCIDHDIADETNQLVRRTFASQVVARIVRWREEQVGKLVRDDTVHLFR